MVEKLKQQHKMAFMSLFNVRDAVESLTLVWSSRAILELLHTRQRPAQLCELSSTGYREYNVTIIYMESNPYFLWIPDHITE